MRNSISLASGVVALSATALTATAASANTTSPTPAPTATSNTQTPGDPGTRHCRIVLDRLQPGEKFSRVISRTCSDNQADLGINARVDLMTWYEHADYGGSSTTVKGDYGPCDQEGYGIRDTGIGGFEWRLIISSFKVYNNCNWSQAYTNTNYGGTVNIFYQNVRNVGSDMNDKIRSFIIHA
ncbi:hypothetical protein [Actinomadura sp. 3N407]|uniref:hypothetical protein n=1 Tax=Actinomadura sp. 3N407 TaxID=3457423 RepID=UPI003FCE2524